MHTLLSHHLRCIICVGDVCQFVTITVPLTVLVIVTLMLIPALTLMQHAQLLTAGGLNAE